MGALMFFALKLNFGIIDLDFALLVICGGFNGVEVGLDNRLPPPRGNHGSLAVDFYFAIRCGSHQIQQLQLS